MEILIVGAVDERVDTAVGEHGHHREVVEVATEVGRVAHKVQEDEDLIPRPAQHEQHSHRDQGLHDVVLGSLEVVRFAVCGRFGDGAGI